MVVSYDNKAESYVILMSFLLPVTLLAGIIVLYRIQSKTKEPKNSLVNHVPLSPITTMEFIKERLRPDFPLFRLHDMRQMNVPTYRMKILIMDIIVTNDVHLVRQVLKDKATYKSPVTDAILQFHHGGSNILTSDELFWKHSRKAMDPAFSSTHLKRMTKVVQNKTEEFIAKRIDPMVKRGEAIDICKETVHLTLDIICEAAFEYEIAEDEQQVFVQELHLILKEGVKKMIIPLRARFGKYFIPSAKRAYLSSLRLVNLGTNILKSYRALKNPIKGTVIDQIAQNVHYKSDMERVNDILILLAAGHETTANTISWILLELAKKPREQRLLRKELKQHAKENCYNLPMLRNVVKEGMRLQPAVPILDRITGNEILYKMEGHSKEMIIPKGTRVSCSNFVLCRNEKYFKDPDDFIPSRWENASDDAIAAVIPFVLGKRNCVGQSLAMIEINVVLAHLCSNYHFSVKSEGSPSFHITWKPEGVRLIAIKCSNNDHTDELR